MSTLVIGVKNTLPHFLGPTVCSLVLLTCEFVLVEEIFF